MSEQNIVNISEANLQQTLQQSMNVPVLFYFWSARSQHCEQLTPVLERLAAQYLSLIHISLTLMLRRSRSPALLLCVP